MVETAERQEEEVRAQMVTVQTEAVEALVQTRSREVCLVVMQLRSLPTRTRRAFQQQPEHLV
jgi:hypothetical protein